MLRAKNLQKTYKMGRAHVKVLRGASITAERGEFLVVRGTSGSGKSTLLHILGALDEPDSGSVEFIGEHGQFDIFAQSSAARARFRNGDVGFVFQFYHLLPEFTVLENVLMARLVKHSVWQWLAVKSQAKRDAEEILERVGLEHRLAHRPNELSGGERQRVAMARALINRPALLLADEPTGNLDQAMGADILKLLTELNADGQTTIMVTHDANVASRAHRQLQLVEGRIRPIAANDPMLSASRSIKEVAS